jgi:uncharacterized protein YjbI with pentapeptide repeats
MEFTGELRGRDFAGSDLAGAVFRDADLYRASFAGANLEGATFLNCFAAEALLENARCAGLQAVRTSFYHAIFRSADLADALLWKCVLADSDFRGAKLKGLTVTLDCNSFEGVLLDHASSAELAYLFGRARSPHQDGWQNVLGERDVAWLERVFAR